MLKFTAWTVRKIPWGNYWEVVESFVWYNDYENKKDEIVVSKGFRTNFGSIPRIFWFAISPTDWNGYVLHDNCYQTQYRCRETSDYILYLALRAEGCNTFTATLIYYTLRLFGWYAWNGCKKRLLQMEK